MNIMKKFKEKENQIFLAITVIAIVMACLPVFSKYCLQGHDSEYHLLRIEALKDAIQKGVPVLKVNTLFFGDMGYASSMFYPDFLLYIPAILRVLGFSMKISYHTFIIVCVALTFYFAYYAGKSICNNRYAGLLSAVLFTLCSYHIDDIYVRAAVGEYTAYIFLPLLLYGIYNMCYEKMSKPWILGIGMAGVLLCHTLSFAACVGIAGLLFILNIKKFIEDKKLLVRLIVTALITMAATSSYWIPMIEQMASAKFYVSNSWIDPYERATGAGTVFSLLFPTVGVALLMFVIPRIVLKRQADDSALKFADQCLVLGLLFSIASRDIFPWERFGQYVSFIQFPWRLYQISSALLSIAGAIILYKFIIYINGMFSSAKTEHIVSVVVLSIMVLTTMYSYTNQERTYYDYSLDYYSYKPYTATVIAGEWLPLSVTDPQRLVDQSEICLDNNGNECDFYRYKNRLTVTVDKAEYVDVPFIYYKGYAAKCDNGQQLSVDGSGDNGEVRVYSNGYSGNIEVYYKGTTLQHLSKIISILTVVALIALAIKKRRAICALKDKEIRVENK